MVAPTCSGDDVVSWPGAIGGAAGAIHVSRAGRVGGQAVRRPGPGGADDPHRSAPGRAARDPGPTRRRCRRSVSGSTAGGWAPPGRRPYYNLAWSPASARRTGWRTPCTAGGRRRLPRQPGEERTVGAGGAGCRPPSPELGCPVGLAARVRVSSQLTTRILDRLEVGVHARCWAPRPGPAPRSPPADRALAAPSSVPAPECETR